MGVNPNYGSSSLNRYQAEEIYILEVNAEGFYEAAVWWTPHRTLSTSVSSGDRHDGDT